MSDKNTGGGERWKLDFTLNGERRAVEIDAGVTLLELLRMELGLMGTKGAYQEGECGSCTVLLDGKPVNSCLVMAPQVQGCSVTTIEGLASGGKLHVLQEKFIETGAAQCGYCTPGLILAATALLEKDPFPGEDEFLATMEGNICRCTGYSKIFGAVRRAWHETRAQRPG